jgi:hypothetical protein
MKERKKNPDISDNNTSDTNNGNKEISENNEEIENTDKNDRVKTENDRQENDDKNNLAKTVNKTNESGDDSKMKRNSLKMIFQMRMETSYLPTTKMLQISQWKTIPMCR